MNFDSSQTLAFKRIDEVFNSDYLYPSFMFKQINIMIWDCFALNILETLIVYESERIEAEEYVKIFAKRFTFLIYLKNILIINFSIIN